MASNARSKSTQKRYHREGSESESSSENESREEEGSENEIDPLVKALLEERANRGKEETMKDSEEEGNHERQRGRRNHERQRGRRS